MNQQDSRGVWSALTALSAVVVVGLWLHTPSIAVEGNDEPDGPIVQISPDDDGVREGAGQADDDRADVRNPPEAPKFWIGIQGRTVESPVLRTHLQLAEDLGVVIEQVVRDSPANLAGLREHDVLIGVNGEPLQDMSGLQKAVAEGNTKPIRLQVIRLAKEIEIEVTPAEMPEEVRRRAAEFSPFGANPFGPVGGNPNDVLRDLLGAAPGADIRDFGFGGQEFRIPAIPGGVSVSITKNGDEPAKITVKQGEKTWVVEGDDPESLEKLPEDLRPFVERMLDRPAAANLPRREFFRRQFNLNDEIDELLPDILGGRGGGLNNRARGGIINGDAIDSDDTDREVMERMQNLERRLEELQNRIEGDDP